MYAALAWLTSTAGTEAQIGDTFWVPPIPEIGGIAYGQNGLWVARHAGYAVVKDQATGGYLAVSASFHTWHHKHADDGSFELYDRNGGSWPTRDLRRHDRRYQLRPLRCRPLDAHGRRPGLPLVLAQAPRQAEPYGPDGDRPGCGWYAILVTNPMLHRQGVSQERLFLYHPGLALIVCDDVRSKRAHRYTRYFQLGPDVAASKRSASALRSAEPARRARSTTGPTLTPGRRRWSAGGRIRSPAGPIPSSAGSRPGTR